MDPIPVAALAYAGPDALPSLRPPWRTAALRLVQACWALPLAAGLFIFIAAWASGRDRSELWAVAGLWDIAVGTALAAVGGIAILTFVAGRWQAAAGDRWRQVFRARPPPRRLNQATRPAPGGRRRARRARPT
jgi:hypothetical protein